MLSRTSARHTGRGGGVGLRATRALLKPRTMANVKQTPLFPGVRKHVTKFEGQYTFSYGMHTLQLLREGSIAAVVPVACAVPYVLSLYSYLPLLPLEAKLAYVAAVVLTTRLIARGARNRVVKDLRGRHVVVTGATSGIGRETAAQLAAMGADVTIVAPDTPRAEAAVRYVRAAAAADTQAVVFQALNLSDFIAVRDFCKRQRRAQRGIDVLVNCAGVLQQHQRTTRFGDDVQLAVNYLGPYLLTEGLLPLVAAARGRVVYVSCSAHVGVRGNIVATYLTGRGVWSPRVADKFDGLEQYGFTKLGNIYHAQDLAVRSYPEPARPNSLRLAASASAAATAAAAAPNDGPAYTTCACNPGGVLTNIYRDLPSAVIFQYLYYFFLVFMRSAREGSQTVVNCAVRDELRTGGYYMNARYCPAGLSAAACDVKEREQVMAWTRKKMGPYMKWD